MKRFVLHLLGITVLAYAGFGPAHACDDQPNGLSFGLSIGVPDVIDEPRYNPEGTYSERARCADHARWEEERNERAARAYLEADRHEREGDGAYDFGFYREGDPDMR